MYDRLMDSNNSNDGRNVKHVREKPQNRKWSETTGQQKRKTTEVPKGKVQKQLVRTVWSTKPVETAFMPS